jgi:hypothetical protein
MVDKDGQGLLAQCKLCLNERHLQKSHLVPRAYYKLLRTPGADDPNPITADAETTRTSQEQLAKHLLCASCEDLLNKNGERWVLLNNYRLDGPSPLYRALNAAEADMNFLSGTVYRSLAIPEIDMDKLVYFGTSIFWRAAIADWTMNRKLVPLMSLGVYQEQFRRYLHAEAGFPQNAAIWVAVVRSESPAPLISFPTGERVGKYHRHTFDVFGLSYMLYVGGSLPQEVTQFCAARAANRYIFFTDIGEIVDRKAARLFDKSMPTKKLLDRARKDGLRE